MDHLRALHAQPFARWTTAKINSSPNLERHPGSRDEQLPMAILRKVFSGFHHRPILFLWAV